MSTSSPVARSIRSVVAFALIAFILAGGLAAWPQGAAQAQQTGTSTAKEKKSLNKPFGDCSQRRCDLGK